MSRTVFITGATAGIGEATAEVFAAAGDRLILTGRRRARLAALADRLDTECFVLTFDVREKKQVQEAMTLLPAEWQAVDILINNQ